MEEDYFELYKRFTVGDYHANCSGYKFIVTKGGENHGIKLVVFPIEDFETITFDPEKKTVSVQVKNPVPKYSYRTMDLSDATDFFDGLRENIESILTTRRAKYKSVIPNEDRTVFTVSK